MALKTLCGFAAAGIICVATSHAAWAEVKFEGETATFEFPSDDRDLAKLDQHPKLKTIVFGGSEVYDSLGPIRPFGVTDAGFAHVANCPLLEKFMLNGLHDVPISDVGTAHFARLQNLEELWLDGNRHVGDGTLRTVSKLSKLCVLRFHLAPITDEGIAEIASLTALEDLQLGWAKVGDAGMATIGTFTKLKLLDLQHTQVTDAGMAHLKSLNLRWLCFHGTAVTGDGLAGIAQMTDLEHLFWAGGKGVDDASLDHLARLTKLRELALTGTSVTEAGLAKLAPLKNLGELWLDGLPIGDGAIPSLIALRGLKRIHANDTRITEQGFKKLAGAGIRRNAIKQ